jgi:K+-transporting ATPase c subunit
VSSKGKFLQIHCVFTLGAYQVARVSIIQEAQTTSLDEQVEKKTNRRLNSK